MYSSDNRISGAPRPGNHAPGPPEHSTHRHMTTRNNTKTTLAALAGLALAAGSAQAAVIFADDFIGNPDTGLDGLNGESPDVGSGTWVASSSFNANGTYIAGAGSSATLAFAPSDGFIYTLDARVNIATSGQWIALGFGDGQSTAVGNNSRFTNGSTPLGAVWMLRIDGAAGRASQDGTNGQHETWTGVDNVTGSIDLRIVLDTQTTGDWTATWFAKDDGDTSYTEVWTTENVISEASIDSVGFALSGGSATGSIGSFSLSTVPEPSATALLGLGCLALILRRRK